MLPTKATKAAEDFQTEDTMKRSLFFLGACAAVAMLVTPSFANDITAAASQVTSAQIKINKQTGEVSSATIERDENTQSGLGVHLSDDTKHKWGAKIKTFLISNKGADLAAKVDKKLDEFIKVK